MTGTTNTKAQTVEMLLRRTERMDGQLYKAIKALIAESRGQRG